MNRWRAHIVANFTWHRWRINPFQMYSTAFLLLVSTAQLGVGMAPTSPTYHLYDNTQLALSFCNLWGCLIVLYSLHMREIETALWVEMCGYLSLVFVLVIYVYLLLTRETLAFTTQGFAFSQAFVYAAIQRSVQIWLYKRARRRKDRLDGRVERLKEVLRIDHLDPNEPVIGEDDDG